MRRIDRIFTDHPMAKGFLYRVAIIDWATRRVLAWRLSNTLTTELCVAALGQAIARYGAPEIFNTDPGCPFTAEAFTGVLKRHGIRIRRSAGKRPTRPTSGNRRPPCGRPEGGTLWICGQFACGEPGRQTLGAVFVPCTAYARQHDRPPHHHVAPRQGSRPHVARQRREHRPTGCRSQAHRHCQPAQSGHVANVKALGHVGRIVGGHTATGPHQPRRCEQRHHERQQRL